MRRRKQDGGVFIFALAVMVALVGIVASFSAVQRSSIRAQQNRMDASRARMLAESGIERALAELVLPAVNTFATTLQDPWALLGDIGNQRFLVGTGSFRVEIVDGASLINLNTASEEQLLRLPLTTEQVDSLLDWRSDTGQARPEGAKDEYYNSLDEPYNAALRPLESLDELFLVKGWSAATLYQRLEEPVSTQFLVPGGPEDQPLIAELVTVDSRSPDLGPDGQAKLNVNTATPAQMAARGLPLPLAMAIVQRRNLSGTFARLGDVLLTPGVNSTTAATILDNFAVDNDTVRTGRINVNTASEPVLNSVPGFTPDIAASLVSRQLTAGLATFGELASVPGLTVPVLAQCVDFLTVSSSTYLVRSIGEHGSSRVALEAVVSVEGGIPRVVKVYDSPMGDMRGLWRWAADPTTDVDLMEGM